MVEQYKKHKKTHIMEKLFEEIVEEKERSLIAIRNRMKQKGEIALVEKYIAQIEVVEDLVREWDRIKYGKKEAPKNKEKEIIKILRKKAECSMNTHADFNNVDESQFAGIAHEIAKLFTSSETREEKKKDSESTNASLNVPVVDGDFVLPKSKCKYTDCLNAIHSKIKTYRDYWLFTEVFCLLHDNNDFCNCD